MRVFWSVLFLVLLGGCMLPRPLIKTDPYTVACPLASSAPGDSLLIVSFRLPDCQSGVKWTDYRSPVPVYAAQLDSGSTIFLTKQDWDKLLESKVIATRRHPIVYIHGYKNSQREAELRARAIIALPEEQRPVIALTWPSYGRLAKYFWDEANNDFVRPEAARLLLALGTSYPRTVLIAHSMGNRILLDIPRPDDRPLPFEQLILAAPDVDRKFLIGRLASTGGAGAPVTLYASRADQALSASWRSHGLPRGGDLSRWVTGREMDYVYLDAKNTDIVDTSDTPAGKIGHAAFIETVAGAADLCRLLSNGDIAQGRINLGRRHWLLKTVSPPDICAARAKKAVDIALGKAKPR